MVTEYWKPLLDFLAGTLAARGTIDRSDLDLLHVTDSVEEMAAVVERSMAANAPEWSRRPKRSRILGE